jgi:hypothetical protein
VSNILLYDTATGEIESQLIGQLNPCDWDPDSQSFVELETPLSHDQLRNSNIDPSTKQLVPKTVIPYTTTGRPVADSTTEYILALPEGTIYEHEALEDNSLEFTFDEPGPFVISLTNPLYSPLELTINVEAT